MTTLTTPKKPKRLGAMSRKLDSVMDLADCAQTLTRWQEANGYDPATRTYREPVPA